MKASFSLIFRLLPSLTLLIPAIAKADAVSQNNCAVGVLVSGNCVNQTMSFPAYISKLLEQNFPLILFAAFLMVVFSGVQYMLSGAAPEGQKAARQRILGILGGLAFYLFIKLILHQLSSNLS